MTDVDLPVDTGDFRLVSRGVLDAYKKIGEQQPFVRGVISWLGFNQIGIEYTREPRVAGRTKYSMQKMWRLAMNSLASFSDKPLRLAVRFGLAFSVFAVIMGIVWVFLAKYVFDTAISGWASLLLVVVFLGGVNLFFLGVVGMYLSRVYDEVKARPRFVISEKWYSTPRTSARVEEKQAEPHVGLQ
jgi:dolichol-phosphate mannosyltransferase